MNRRHFLTTTALAASAIAAPDEKKWRVAVIGHTGHGDYGHGLDVMWLQMPETEIVGVADADAAGLEKARTKLKGPPGFADYRAMLAEVKPDIVAIGPRHVDEHRDIALAAIEAGARGIYSEKPFCRTLAEADEIIAACERRGTKYAVAHRNRYHPVLATIDGLIESDTIGRVLEMRARGKEDQRGGALDLWVLGTHVLNLANYFSGAPRACSAVLLQDGKPATHADVVEGAEGVGPIAGNEVHARFETERGIPVFFESIAKAGNSGAGFGLQIIGTKGLIDLRTDREPMAHLVPGSPFQPGKDARPWIPITTGGPGQPEPLGNGIKDVMNHVAAGRDLISAIRENRAPLCSAADARVIIECIAAIFESHRQEGRRVTLPLVSRDNPLAKL
jgi:predicted dehydrogenase